MNSETSCQKTRVTANVLAILGTFRSEERR